MLTAVFYFLDTRFVGAFQGSDLAEQFGGAFVAFLRGAFCNLRRPAVAALPVGRSGSLSCTLSTFVSGCYCWNDEIILINFLNM